MHHFLLIPIWHKWNVNSTMSCTYGLHQMQTLVMSCQACAACVHVHGTCSLHISGVPIWSLYMEAKPTLDKISTSHYQVLNTQFANDIMPKRILIAQLNKNIPDCNENLGVGKQEPLLHPDTFWY